MGAPGRQTGPPGSPWARNSSRFARDHAARSGRTASRSASGAATGHPETLRPATTNWPQVTSSSGGASFHMVSRTSCNKPDIGDHRAEPGRSPRSAAATSHSCDDYPSTRKSLVSPTSVSSSPARGGTRGVKCSGAARERTERHRPFGQPGGGSGGPPRPPSSQPK